MSLKKKLTALLADASRMCVACNDAKDLGKEIIELAKRVNQPLRVAVVGIMKAGKSTFMNALIKERLLYTGTEETTYTVSWFKYAPKPSLNIVFKNEKFASETAPFEDLEKWTVRKKAAENPRINDVKYIEIYYPNEVLKTMELIDTPGLNSSYELDSKNTLEFLGVKSIEEAKALEERTLKEASLAEAIIYAYTRSASVTDKDLLQEFHGNSLTSSTSPINALGVFTRSDMFWEPGSKQSPVQIAERVTDKTMKNPEMKRLLYTTIPVVAKVIEGIASLSNTDWDYLKGLTNIDRDTLCDLLEYQPSFTGNKISDFKDESVRQYIGEPETRKSIINRLDGYGLYEIVDNLRKGMSETDILDLLYEETGIKEVSNLVTTHFGNRAFLIKSQYIFLHLKSVCGTLQRTSQNSALKEICKYVLDEIDHIEITEHIFQELKVLQNYYNSQFSFNDEGEYNEFLEVTGEKGKHCEAKLGVSAALSVLELAAIAKEKNRLWNARANEYGVSRQYEQAAKTIARSYDNLLYHLDELSGN